MSVRSIARTTGIVSAGVVAGFVGVSVTTDSPRLEMALRSLGKRYPKIDGFNPVPITLLIGCPVAAFILARRTNQRSSR